VIKAVEKNKQIKGALPIGWEIAQVKDVCDIIRGVSYKKVDSIQEAKKGYLPILRATNIQDNSLVLDKDLVYIPSNQVSENQILKIGDIVIATSSGSKHLVGKTAQVKEKWYGAFGAFCAAIRSTVGIEYRYLGYFFNSPAYKDVISAKAIGVNINNLRRGDIEELQIPIAPTNEQKRIVTEIEKQFSRLDEAVANLKRIKANLKRYKASVLKAAVEGRLTEEWRKANPDVEPADKLLERILIERRRKWEESELAKMRAKGKDPKNDKWKKKYKEPLLPATKGLANSPGSWTFVGIEQILLSRKDAMKTGPFGTLLKKYEHKQKGVQVLGIENIQAMKFIFGSKIHIDSDKAKELVGYRTIPGDVIISRSGTVGEVCVVPENIGEARISTNLMKLSFEKKGMLPQFFTFIFNGAPFVLNQVSELCKGSTRNFLNQNILKKLVLILPPFEEQRLIIQKVENKLSIIDEIDKEVDKNLKRANRLRQSILEKAFTGKLVPQINDNESPVIPQKQLA